jgi:hypothetical protein
MRKGAKVKSQKIWEKGKGKERSKKYGKSDEKIKVRK